MLKICDYILLSESLLKYPLKYIHVMLSVSSCVGSQMSTIPSEATAGEWVSQCTWQQMGMQRGLGDL